MRMIFMGILIFCCGKSSCLLIIDPHTHTHICHTDRQICIDACIDIMQVALDWTYEHASKFLQTYLTYRSSVHTILRIANTFVQLLFWYSRQTKNRSQQVRAFQEDEAEKEVAKERTKLMKNLVTWENQPQRLTGIVPWWCRVVSGDYGKPRFRVSSGCRSIVLAAGGGFKHVFIFTPKIGEAEPILTSIFFNWVETTN